MSYQYPITKLFLLLSKLYLDDEVYTCVSNVFCVNPLISTITSPSNSRSHKSFMLEELKSLEFKYLVRVLVMMMCINILIMFTNEECHLSFMFCARHFFKI